MLSSDERMHDAGLICPGLLLSPEDGGTDMRKTRMSTSRCRSADESGLVGQNKPVQRVGLGSDPAAHAILFNLA